MRAAMESAAAAATELVGVQLHGTGTSLGDPIEVGALSGVMKVSASTRIRQHSTAAAHRDLTCS